MVKIGWEALLPQRTKARKEPSPPQKMMEQIGVPASTTHSTFRYSEDQEVFWFSLLLHFTFSNFFAILFIFVSQYSEKNSIGQGTAYGLAIWAIWHLGLMPATKTVPSPIKQAFDEHFSEILGHIVWGAISPSAYYLITKSKK
ncbi:DUF1440 domain-containing protein [Lactococcus sp. dk322]|uniref:DUF1440 domain-containing protein n=1 Tax=Lactococcus sp. dk322 TaxID=2603290 RepID=UPI0011CA2668|nr:DUF1440 domain-containing protein [Lactococcus sp. dk322]TXK47391.1 DUF1440 domain-containing protein [Lactococcus sp. dk322]